MANVIVSGMKATPTEPTFMEQRDALLSTAWTFGRQDEFTALARGFAKRGFGIGAIAPPTSSTTLNEAVENFDFKGNLAFVDAKLDDSVRSCDNDGVLDSGESGKLTIRIKNGGWLSLTHTGLFAQTTPDVVLENGGQVSVQSIDPYGVATVAIGARMKDGVTMKSVVQIGVTVSDFESYVPSISNSVPALINADEAPGTSATDDVESKNPLWTLIHGTTTHNTWARVGDASNHYWHGVDMPVPSDESLASPSLTVSATDHFTIAFDHRFQFEHNTTQYFDGGVLEISDDDGATWKDVSTYVDPAYPQTLFTQPPDTNVLAGKKAWGGDSAGYPAYVHVSLDLGTQLAGKTAKVRFRVGTDDGGSSTGWDIDNIAFGGITNKPFATIVDDGTVCAGPDGGTALDSGGGGPQDSGSDSSVSIDGGFVDEDSGSQGHDAGPSIPEATDGGLDGGGCATSPSTNGAGGGFLVAIAALFARRRRSR
jgi:MYXO-CTERM domain-containing protein